MSPLVIAAASLLSGSLLAAISFFRTLTPRRVLQTFAECKDVMIDNLCVHTCMYVCVFMHMCAKDKQERHLLLFFF